MRLSESAPKADSKNANPALAMVDVSEPVRARGSGFCGAGASSAVSSCAGFGSCSGSGSEIIGTGIGSGFGSGVVTGVGSGSGFGVGGTTGGFGGSGLGGSGLGGSGFGLVTVKYVTDIPIVFVYVFGT
ncbi:hypothetical protein CGSMWGv6119V5_02516 [Gardnerella vaginalis 6119V5]|nr:hypothetical protein CGSMWGv6119V5_02516 [Gardnerella vaginalis 6119V5]